MPNGRSSSNSKAPRQRGAGEGRRATATLDGTPGRSPAKGKSKDKGKGELRGSRFRKAGESPGFLLWQVSNIWQRKVRRSLETVGLTHVQFVLLAGIQWLTGAGKSVTQVELARATKTDAMTVSQVLSWLEARGMLVRTQHPDDSRAKSLRLAPGREELLATAVRLVEQADNDFFSPIGDDNIQSLIEAMRVLVTSSTP